MDYAALFDALAADAESNQPLLTDIQRFILRRRFGVPAYSLPAIAEEFQVPPERIQHVEFTALRAVGLA